MTDNLTIPFPFCTMCGVQMKDNLKTTLILHKKTLHAKEYAKMRRKQRINIAIVVAFIVAIPAFVIIMPNTNSVTMSQSDQKCFNMELSIDNKISNNNFNHLSEDIQKMTESCYNVSVSFFKGHTTQTTVQP